MTVTSMPLTNKAYGFPTRGAARRVAPIALVCVHMTGNSNNLGATAATGERNYANRADSPGPSAHDYLNRDGSRVSAIQPAYAAWSNGDLRSPNLALAGVKAIVAFKAKGFNANEAFVREVECVAYPGSAPVTAAQLATIADLIARDSIRTGIAISRTTVLTHGDLNTETRPNCAFPPALREAIMAALIAAAKARKAAIQTPVVVPPVVTYTKAQLDTAVAAAVAAARPAALAEGRLTGLIDGTLAGRKAVKAEVADLPDAR